MAGKTLREDVRLFSNVVESLGGMAYRAVSQLAFRRNLTFIRREADLPVALNRRHSHLFTRGDA